LSKKVKITGTKASPFKFQRKKPKLKESLLDQM